MPNFKPLSPCLGRITTRRTRSHNARARSLGIRALSTVPLPPGSWDSHVHVVDETQFPLHPSHPYRPKIATLESLLSFHRSLSPAITHPVIVSLSVYANDNRCLLHALQQLSGRGRGVVGIDPATVTDKELEEMHAIGVRGVRLNLKSSLVELSRKEFEKTLWEYTERLKLQSLKRKWALQIHLGLPQVTQIADILPKLGVTVIIDHLAHPAIDRPAREQEGYKDFLRLLSNGDVYTKLSGTDRFPTLPLTDEYCSEVVKLAPERTVWSSDWPHTGGVKGNPGGDRNKVQDFRQVDDEGTVKRAVEIWCRGDEEVVRKIWRDNARELWDWDRDD
ncbi:hypothetical protein ABW19_dt0205796 [Dactylella cylindrospora]|nr:hypothetical protein ABW19_dt0205796 [Dactylella cylindrospora]